MYYTLCNPCWMLRKADGCATEGYSSMIIAQWKGRGDGGVNISDSPTLSLSLIAVPPNIVDAESSPSSVSVRENHNASLGRRIPMPN